MDVFFGGSLPYSCVNVNVKTDFVTPEHISSIVAVLPPLVAGLGTSSTAFS